jgi:nucleoside phosphorylase
VIRGRSGTAKVAILVVTPEEWEAARSVFEAHETLVVRGAPHAVTSINPESNYEFVIKKCMDRSQMPAGEALGKLIEYFSPPYILLIGTAGGMKKRDGTEVGDVLVADFVDYVEFRKLHGGKSLVRKVALDHPSALLRDMAETIQVSIDWRKFIKRTRPSNGQSKVLVGNLASSEKILSDESSELQKAILDEYGKALAFETEAYGVARRVYDTRRSVHYNPQYLVIRGISDLVDEPQSNEMRKEWTPYAAEAALAFGRALTELILSYKEESENEGG